MWALPNYSPCGFKHTFQYLFYAWKHGWQSYSESTLVLSSHNSKCLQVIPNVTLLRRILVLGTRNSNRGPITWVKGMFKRWYVSWQNFLLKVLCGRAYCHDAKSACSAQDLDPSWSICYCKHSKTQKYNVWLKKYVTDNCSNNKNEAQYGTGLWFWHSHILVLQTLDFFFHCRLQLFVSM
jgi:hypothetical protein